MEPGGEAMLYVYHFFVIYICLLVVWSCASCSLIHFLHEFVLFVRVVIVTTIFFCRVLLNSVKPDNIFHIRQYCMIRGYDMLGGLSMLGGYDRLT